MHLCLTVESITSGLQLSVTHPLSVGTRIATSPSPSRATRLHPQGAPVCSPTPQGRRQPHGSAGGFGGTFVCLPDCPAFVLLLIRNEWSTAVSAPHFCVVKVLRTQLGNSSISKKIYNTIPISQKISKKLSMSKKFSKKKPKNISKKNFFQRRFSTKKRKFFREKCFAKITISKKTKKG